MSAASLVQALASPAPATGPLMLAPPAAAPTAPTPPQGLLAAAQAPAQAVAQAPSQAVVMTPAVANEDLAELLATMRAQSREMVLQRRAQDDFKAAMAFQADQDSAPSAGARFGIAGLQLFVNFIAAGAPSDAAYTLVNEFIVSAFVDGPAQATAMLLSKVPLSSAGAVRSLTKGLPHLAPLKRSAAPSWQQQQQQQAEPAAPAPGTAAAPRPRLQCSSCKKYGLAPQHLHDPRTLHHCPCILPAGTHA